MAWWRRCDDDLPKAHLQRPSTSISHLHRPDTMTDTPSSDPLFTPSPPEKKPSPTYLLASALLPQSMEQLPQHVVRWLLVEEN